MQLIPDIVEYGDDLCVGLGLEVAVGVRGRRDGSQLGVQRGLRPRGGWKGFISVSGCGFAKKSHKETYG